MNIEDFLLIFEWYGVADGERGVKNTERKLILSLYDSLSEEDRATVYKSNWEEIDDIRKCLK